MTRGLLVYLHAAHWCCAVCIGEERVLYEHVGGRDHAQPLAVIVAAVDIADERVVDVLQVPTPDNQSVKNGRKNRAGVS